MIVGVVTRVFGIIMANLNHRNGWVLYQTTESKIWQVLPFPEKNRKEPPRPIHMTMEEIDSDWDPMDDQGNLEGGKCYTVKSVDPVK